MEWEQLSADEAKAFLDAVRDDAEAALFDAQICDVYHTPLTFYDGYNLTRIVNRFMMPFVTLDYVSNGVDHYYLDSSDMVHQTLNARGVLSLNVDNVCDYFDFFISYVYERGSSFEFSHKENDERVIALQNHDETGYTLTANMFYQGAARDCKILIKPNGGIDILEPAIVSFISTPSPALDKVEYRHPHETKIIEETKTLLEQTDRGRHLLMRGGEYGVDIRVFNSPNYRGYTNNKLQIYLFMPSLEQSAKYLQAVTLALCLRDAQQIHMGFKRRAYRPKDPLFPDSNYLKNLDMIGETCIIVGELEAQGITEGTFAINSMGLCDVYKAHKNGFDAQELMKVYLESLEKQGLME